ncbi:MAG: CDP-glycerol glycerophosphotransferase family protein, partial [Planctomycetota bacterium JB042]
TGDAGNSLFRHGEEILAALARLDVNVICKPHDHADPDPKCSIDWLARLKTLEGERLRCDLGFDIVPLLFAADLLLTDASSCAFEYALLDRPIVFIEVPEILEGPNAAQFDLDTWGRKAGHVVRGVGEMTAEIERRLDDPSEKGEIRRALAEDLFHQPGRATANAAAAILEEVGLEARPELSGTPAAGGAAGAADR